LDFFDKNLFIPNESFKFTKRRNIIMQKETSVESPKRTLLKDWLNDRKYPLSAIVGLIVLVGATIIIHFYRGTKPWLEIFAYPLLLYFIFQQVLSGFGFITGYIPIAIDIINWLTKTSKKKSFDKEEIEQLETELKQIEAYEKREQTELAQREEKLAKKMEELATKKESGRWSGWKLKRETKKVAKEKAKIEKEKKELEGKFKVRKEKIKKKLKEYRGKLSEKIITKQEQIEPHKFKLIMLIPIYIMLGLGIILALIGLINPIVRWASGYTIPTLDTFDIINEWYKGIIAAWGIISFYIIPSIRILKDPSKEYIPRMIVVEEKRRFRLFRRKKKEDIKTILNRQFEDLRKYYWDIKQLIGKALLIPIGLSMLIAAPLGAMSVTLGIQTSIRRKKTQPHELVVLILVAIALICMVVPTYFSFFARFLKNIHPIIPILLKIIYIPFLILSFILFMRQPIASIKTVDEN